MSDEYRNNHYVPQWYQKRFVPPAQRDQELFYLQLNPGTFTDPRGIAHLRRAVRRQGFRYCFAQRDLYTTRFRSEDSVLLEKQFFGDVDRNGHRAVDYFESFAHPSLDGPALEYLLLYMSTQKLRTPKGLEWLSNQAGSDDRNQLLALVVRLQQIYCATWTECVWLIADASQSETKFIISDHPVTIYNRRCGPRSQWCRSWNDPDIRFHASHTLFPLSLEKILILTNLSWVRNPYQSEVGIRPNPARFRGTVFNFTDIQTLRHLSEFEVREVNFIIKSRAYQYIAAGRQEWLYPEKHVSKSDWRDFGNGYLLMPDPRAVNYGGQTIIGWGDGSASHYDAFGRRPWQKDYGKEEKSHDDFRTLYRFKGEFARLNGSYRRGRSMSLATLDEERDSDDLHAYHLTLDKKQRNK